MKRSFVKWVAFALSVALFASFSMTIYANEQEPDSTMRNRVVENDAEPDVLRVVLPTDVVGIFDFILDPQELIYATNASAYGGKTFEEGATLFFERLEEDAEADYSSTSDAVMFTNRGDMPVDIKVTASVTASPSDCIEMTDDREFTDDISVSVYLALTDGETTVPIMDGEEASIHAAIPAASEEADGVYSFRLTGAVNRNGDWDSLEDIVFGVEVTWVITPNKEAPPDVEQPAEQNEETPVNISPEAVATPSTTPATVSEASNIEGEKSALPSIKAASYALTDGEPLVIEVGLGSGDTAAAGVSSVYEKETDRELLDDSDAVYEDARITLSTDYINSCLEDESFEQKTLVIVFDDTAVTEAEVILKKDI